MFCCHTVASVDNGKIVVETQVLKQGCRRLQKPGEERRYDFVYSAFPGTEITRAREKLNGYVKKIIESESVYETNRILVS